MKKRLLLAFFPLPALCLIFLLFSRFYWHDPLFILRPPLSIPELTSALDTDQDGLPDNRDILQGARQEILRHPVYKSVYYPGGYPPETEGVCTDVIWRALRDAGYNLKDLMDADIRAHTSLYPGTSSHPDPNIDFRRVVNQQVYFSRFARSLTTEVLSGNRDNLTLWQAGDIVVLDNHVALVSDKRRPDGIPLVIHNASTFPVEEDRLPYWSAAGKIKGHYRFSEPAGEN